jgi:galactokinase
MPRRVVAFAPGRVNLIGEHTDYNGGLCLPFAIELGLTVSGTPLDRDEIEVHARDLGERDRFPLGAVERVAGWRAYVRGAAAELAAAGHRLRGARLEIRSELPSGAGLASSAALTIATCLALIALGEDEPADPQALARLCARVESDWAGAETGLLDQLAILRATPGSALRIDAATLSVEPVPLTLDGWSLCVLDSGARHEHAGGSYNERRKECRAACALLGVESLSQASLDDLARLEDPLRRRARHVLSENARVELMVAALRRSNPGRSKPGLSKASLSKPGLSKSYEVARLLDEGHASLRDDYEVSVPAVETAVARLRAAGARGARIVGGGFGGCVLGILPPEEPLPTGALAVRAGPGARVRQAGMDDR